MDDGIALPCVPRADVMARILPPRTRRAGLPGPLRAPHQYRASLLHPRWRDWLSRAPISKCRDLRLALVRYSPKMAQVSPRGTEFIALKGERLRNWLISRC